MSIDPSDPRIQVVSGFDAKGVPWSRAQADTDKGVVGSIGHIYGVSPEHAEKTARKSVALCMDHLGASFVFPAEGRV